MNVGLDVVGHCGWVGHTPSLSLAVSSAELEKAGTFPQVSLPGTAW